jgi:hypothetical protein
MKFLNKLPFAVIFPSLRKYATHFSYTIEREIQESFFCVTKLNGRQCYIFSDYLFSFTTNRIYPVNFYLYNLFDSIYKCKKKNFKNNFEKTFLALPYFYDQNKTNLFVNLLISIDSITSLDQLSVDRFWPIFELFINNSHLFSKYILQYRLVIFLLTISDQRPLYLVEKKISLHKNLNDYDKIVEQFNIFKLFLKQIDFREIIKTTNDNIQIENSLLKINNFSTVKQFFDGINCIKDQQIDFDEFNSFFENYLKNNFSNQYIFFINEFKIDSVAVKKRFKQNKNNYFNIITTRKNKIKCIRIKFKNSAILEAYFKNHSLVQNTENHCNSSENFLANYAQCSQEMFLIIEIVSLFKHNILNLNYSNIMNHDVERIAEMDFINAKLIIFYIYIYINTFLQTGNVADLQYDKSWQFKKIKLAKLVTYFMSCNIYDTQHLDNNFQNNSHDNNFDNLNDDQTYLDSDLDFEFLKKTIANSY